MLKNFCLLTVKFKLQKTYDAAVGPGHSKEKNLKDHIRQKLADKLGREITDVWGVELHAGELRCFSLKILTDCLQKRHVSCFY